MNPLPHSIYIQQKEQHQKVLLQLQKKRNLLGWLRLAVIIVAALVAYAVFAAAGVWGWVVVLFGIGLFLWIVSADADNNKNINNISNLIFINNEELQVLDHQFQQRYNGDAFEVSLHAYAADLDIFGPSSLYQYINRSTSEQGRALMAANLLQPLPVDAILLRQEAAKEIAEQVSWRQQIQSLLLQTTITQRAQKKLEVWMADEEEHFNQPALQFLLPLYAIITLGSAVAAIFDLLPVGIFSFSVFSLFYFFFSPQQKGHYSLQSSYWYYIGGRHLAAGNVSIRA